MNDAAIGNMSSFSDSGEIIMCAHTVFIVIDTMKKKVDIFTYIECDSLEF